MAVLYTNNDVAGEVIGLALFVADKVTRGINKPRVVEVISRTEEASGIFVPIPTLPWAIALCIRARNKKECNSFFI